MSQVINIHLGSLAENMYFNGAELTDEDMKSIEDKLIGIVNSVSENQIAVSIGVLRTIEDRLRHGLSFLAKSNVSSEGFLAVSYVLSVVAKLIKESTQDSQSAILGKSSPPT